MVWALVASAIAILLYAGFVFERRSAANDRQTYAATGQMVTTPHGAVHAIIEGARKPGTPGVILDGGLTANSLAWPKLLKDLAGEYQLIAFDRLGHLWSADANGPRSVSAFNTELEALLDALKVEPPYILVGHSYGGFAMRTFASNNKDTVSGIVLAETTPVDWAPKIAGHPGMIFYRVLVALSRFGITRLLRGTPSAEGPLSQWDMQSYKVLSASGRDMATSFAEMTAYPGNAQAAARADLKDVPGVVIAAKTAWKKGDFLPKGMTVDSANADNLRAQKGLSKDVFKGEFWVSEVSDHEIPWHDPGIIAKAVRTLAEGPRP